MSASPWWSLILSLIFSFVSYYLSLKEKVPLKKKICTLIIFKKKNRAADTSILEYSDWKVNLLPAG